MFELPSLLGTQPTSIVVQTRNCTSVENAQSPQPGASDFARYRRMRDHFGARWEERRPPIGIYNCTGHVWATRRTAITDQPEWQKILDEEYVRVTEVQLQIGDLALYFATLDRGPYYLHVAEVVGFSSFARVPRLLSKLDGMLGEILHDLHAVPFRELSRVDYEVAFWTNRP